ncbi:RNA 2',3'-cyclic phosphodiesterase [bacterium]|nr:RNA 2',3'-cyclic phosphodiesterase [bacterium]
MRLFLAIPLEKQILDTLGGVVEKLLSFRAPVRWVRPEGMHLTLKFLGETNEDSVGPLVEAIKGVTSSIPPFPITVTGAGAYPSLRRPRVLWAGVVENSGTLKRLVKNIEEEVEKLGWERERRAFSPHITIGRVKGNMNIARLTAAIKEIKDAYWGDQEVGELVLYSSELKPGGAVYERVHVFPLGKHESSV